MEPLALAWAGWPAARFAQVAAAFGHASMRAVEGSERVALVVWVVQVEPTVLAVAERQVFVVEMSLIAPVLVLAP